MSKVTSVKRILEVATAEFLTKGYKATSTRHIAELAGITQPNLYHHFKSKEELYIAVMEDMTAGIGEELKRLTAEPQGLLEKLNSMATYILEKSPFDPSLMRQDIRENLSEKSAHRLYELYRATYEEPYFLLFEQYRAELRTEFTHPLLVSFYLSLLSAHISHTRYAFTKIDISKMNRFFLYGAARQTSSLASP